MMLSDDRISKFLVIASQVLEQSVPSGQPKRSDVKCFILSSKFSKNTSSPVLFIESSLKKSAYNGLMFSVSFSFHDLF